MTVLADTGSTVACKNSIQIRHILTHTAGFSYGFDKSGLLEIDTIYNANSKLTGAGASGLFGRSVSLEEFVDALAARPLAFGPGGTGPPPPHKFLFCVFVVSVPQPGIRVL
jgi:CubicO group peptidase (beta-lactamase class C family)